MQNTITFSTLKPLVIADLKANIVPMLLGEPGIGKSSELKHIAEELHTKIFVLSVNQLGTREDLTGARSIKDQKTNTYRQIFFPHAAIQDAIDYAKDHPNETPLLFLDEINRSAPDVTSACLQLITERRIGTTNLPNNIRIVAAGNDQGNVSSLDKASITRMSIYKVKPDAESWMKVMQDHLNPYVVKVLNRHANLLMAKPVNANNNDQDESDEDHQDENVFNMLDENNFDQLTVPRTIEYTSNFLTQLGFTGKMDQAEIDAYNTYVGLMEPTSDNNILMNGLIAHLGHSELTDELYNVISDAYEEHLNQNINQNQSKSALDLPELDPQVLDLIQNAKTKSELIQNINTYLHQASNPKEAFETLFLHLMYAPTVSKINNNDRIQTLLNNIDNYAANFYNIDADHYEFKDIISNQFMQRFMQIINNGQFALVANSDDWNANSPAHQWVKLMVNLCA